ncbi:BRCT domain-containing protein [Forsythia ovata]|uniref:BRCT domain-containing protein n=1 Tax=Forsythia ovata TaxID=205694 RepID=A0ABD1VDS0_9LAMI
MLDSKQELVYENPSKPFVGVRFVLLGFDSIKKDKVRLKLLEGGGVDACNYGPDCTHVIVDKLFYDDPICVAARRDGKTLVTDIWIDHSFDVGMPVDSTSVMYRPLRDLNGIPGAKSLIVCLTGYQRQDRDDIMVLAATFYLTLLTQ